MAILFTVIIVCVSFIITDMLTSAIKSDKPLVLKSKLLELGIVVIIFSVVFFWAYSEISKDNTRHTNLSNQNKEIVYSAIKEDGEYVVSSACYACNDDISISCYKVPKEGEGTWLVPLDDDEKMSEDFVELFDDIEKEMRELGDGTCMLYTIQTEDGVPTVSQKTMKDISVKNIQIRIQISLALVLSLYVIWQAVRKFFHITLLKQKQKI